MGQPPTLTDIFQSKHNQKSETKEAESQDKNKQEEESKKGTKRKYDPCDVPEDSAHHSHKPNQEEPNRNKNLKKAKNVGT